MVKQALAEEPALRHGLRGRADAARLGRHRNHRAHLGSLIPNFKWSFAPPTPIIRGRTCAPKSASPTVSLILKKPFDNIEVQQLAHALTKKWLAQPPVAISNWRNWRKLTLRWPCPKSASPRRFTKVPVPSGIQSLPDQRFVDVNQRLVRRYRVCQREDID